MPERYRVATQPFGTVLWDSLTGDRLGIYNTRASAQAEADRLNEDDGAVPA